MIRIRDAIPKMGAVMYIAKNKKKNNDRIFSIRCNTVKGIPSKWQRKMEIFLHRKQNKNKIE